MDKITYTGSQKIIERFLLVVYSVYNITIMFIAGRAQWDYAVSILLMLGILISWIVHTSEFKTYSFRAVFTAVMMQISVIVYATQMDDIVRAFPTFIAFLILLGLYGVPNVIPMTGISLVVIVTYHAWISKTISFDTANDVIKIVSQLANILLIEYIVYIWTKRNREGSEQLLGVIEELKVVESSKDDFVANVSHEIRTPINTICGMSEIILREPLPYKIKENVLNIQMAGRNLMTVVSDILDFSELQSGKIELEEEAYNITSTINDVISMTLAKKNEKKIELIVDCDAGIPCALLGDEKKLRRVIMQLVDNAIKFTEEGCVSIHIGYRKESYGINLVVAVKDTGIGMDPENLEKMFTSFSQADSSRKRQEGGIGLGLAISHALVQKMGGAITVKSKPGKGTTVKFVIPQKILDETPIASIQDRANVNVATYIDMEQFDMVEIRDEYSKTIVHMVEQLRGKCHICRNLAELQRREEKERFSHIFISILEYKKDQKYFDELANRTKVVVILNIQDEKYITNPQILKIYKPFYILSIVSVLNGLYDVQNERYGDNSEKFVTRDAHVLVVDDNRMNIRVIEELLSNYEIKVTTANSGQEALEKITTADYDFIFMDHMMPEMDGVETLQRIRHKVGAYYQKVPIVALTANAVAGTRETLLKEGFTDFLEKPIERSVLERVLKRNLAPEKIIYKEMLEMIEDTTSDIEKVLEAEGLDVQKGILYCNGKEPYIRILQGYCEDFEESAMLADQLYLSQDWKNYTIAVHGMKGAMGSIGAVEVSELARQLEMAGKEGRIDYITDHHDEMVGKYRGLFMRLRRNKEIYPSAEEEEKVEDTVDSSELPSLEEAEFEQMIETMEMAAYSLDGDQLLKIMSNLQNYQYKGVVLSEAAAQGKRKVEMSDYISAVEMIVRVKNGLADKEN